MNPKGVNIWYDPECDFLEVIWVDRPGDFIDTVDGQANIKIDDAGNILGFQIHAVSKITKPLDVTFEYDPIPD
jgi:uncharacterized protein YuzE